MSDKLEPQLLSLLSDMKQGRLGKFDVAAGLSSAQIDDFLSAHWNREHPKPANVYKGSGQLTELKLTWAYDATAPATVRLGQPQGTQGYERWLRGFERLFAPRDFRIPRESMAAGSENIEITIPTISITVATADGAHSATLNFSMAVYGFVSIDGPHLRVVPTRAEVKDIDALERELAKIPTIHDPATKGNACYELREIIVFLINELLAGKITNLVLSFDLPFPLHLISGLVLVSPRIEVQSDHIVALADATAGPAVGLDLTQLQAIAESSIPRRHVNMAYGQDTLPPDGVIWSIITAGHTAFDLPGYPLFLLFSQNFFQVLANALLNIKGSYRKSGGSAVQWEVWYDYDIGDPRVSIQGGNLLVDLRRFEGDSGAHARLCSKLGCLPWVGISISVQAVPAARLNTNFYWNGRDLVMSAGLRPFGIAFHVHGVPWPVSAILDLVLDLLGNLGLAIVELLGKRWEHKLLTLPQTFPGTGMAYTPTLQQNVVNVDGDLAVLGRIHFIP